MPATVSKTFQPGDWELFATGIDGAFSVQCISVGALLELQAAVGETPPDASVRGVLIPTLGYLERASLEETFPHVAGANTLYARGYDGSVAATLRHA
jgi:hypothetical protein